MNTQPAADASTTRPRDIGTEFPKVVYHPKKGAKKVMDAADEATQKKAGFTTTPPAPPKDPADES
jgi:hypothetical protein